MIDKLFFGYSAAKRHNLAFYENINSVVFIFRFIRLRTFK